VPIVVAGHVVRTLDIEDERTDAFEPDDQRLFEAVAGELVPLCVDDAR